MRIDRKREKHFYYDIAIMCFTLFLFFGADRDYIWFQFLMMPMEISKFNIMINFKIDISLSGNPNICSGYVLEFHQLIDK